MVVSTWNVITDLVIKLVSINFAFLAVDRHLIEVIMVLDLVYIEASHPATNSYYREKGFDFQNEYVICMKILFNNVFCTSNIHKRNNNIL